MNQMLNEMKTRKKLNISWIVVTIMFMIAACTGVVNLVVLTIGVIICFGILMLYDKLYLAFPFVLFYNAMYGTAIGLSVMRIFTFFVLCNIFLHPKKKYKIRQKTAIILMIFALYIAVVMTPNIGIFSSLFIFMDILCCFVIVSDIKEKPNALKDFFKVYTLICLISYFSGILAGNYLEKEYTFSRFNGTFEDPNYMGFFFTIGVWALICLKLFDKWTRYSLVVILYVMMLSTISITAILVNIVVWMFYLVIMKKLKLKSVGVTLIIVFMVVSLYNYGLRNPDAKVIGAFSQKIENSFNSFLLGDIGDATTGRTVLAAEHMAYFGSSTIFNIMFGGIPSNSRFIHPDLRVAAHNEYVDMLLNVGIVGTIAMLGYFISTLVKYWKKHKENQEDEYLFYIMGKNVWLLYAMTLTIFLDYRFLFMFLI